jgi:hypothetical protein
MARAVRLDAAGQDCAYACESRSQRQDDAELILPVSSPRSLGTQHFVRPSNLPPDVFPSDDVAALRLSLALTGFIGAEIAGDGTDYGENGRMQEELMMFDEEALHGCVEEDILYWATFVWRLMTNDYTDDALSAGTDCWEPCCPVEGGCKPFFNNGEVFGERFSNNMWQELEEARLGKVLVKAWNRKYTTADEVGEDIRSIASKMNIVIIDDEVIVDGKWEDVFEIVETGSRPHTRILRFKEPESC